MAIKVMLVDDHQLVREALVELLSHEDDIDVVGAAADAEGSLGLARDRRPDVVLMDVAMPGVDGISATRTLLDHCPTTRVLMLSSSCTSTVLAASLAAGACGFLLKGDPVDRLFDGIRAAADGGRPVPLPAGVHRAGGQVQDRRKDGPSPSR